MFGILGAILAVIGLIELIGVVINAGTNAIIISIIFPPTLILIALFTESGRAAGIKIVLGVIGMFMGFGGLLNYNSTY